jgi:monoamine oxidase
MNVTIIGAGASGLACAAELAREKLDVTVVEGRDRIGGRIWTLQSPHTDAPIDLGAEFVHGKAPEIWNMVPKSDLFEGDGDEWCSEEKRIFKCDFFEKIMKVLEKMEAGPSDRSFNDFLTSLSPSDADEKLRLRVLEYISGFNAADPRVISVRSLIEDQKAQDEIEGDRIFRMKHGYSALVEQLYNDCDKAGVNFNLGCAVRKIEWNTRPVRMHCFGANGESFREADRAVVTSPVGVLKSGNMEFIPVLPEQHRKAIDDVMVGQVIRIVFVFKERFWSSLRGENGESLEKMNFLFSHDPCFPTWWSRHPEKSPMLVGWAAATRAEHLLGKPQDELITQAETSLANILHLERDTVAEQVTHAYMHEWHRDNYSRGAYSYFKVGGADAPQRLIKPIANCVFISGEATNTEGHHGTVHGAIAAGREAAKRVLASI